MLQVLGLHVIRLVPNQLQMIVSVIRLVPTQLQMTIQLSDLYSMHVTKSGNIFNVRTLFVACIASVYLNVVPLIIGHYYVCIHNCMRLIYGDT